MDLSKYSDDELKEMLSKKQENRKDNLSQYSDIELKRMANIPLTIDEQRAEYEKAHPEIPKWMIDMAERTVRNNGKISTRDYINASARGISEGAEDALDLPERMLNGYSFGAYDWAGDKLANLIGNQAFSSRDRANNLLKKYGSDAIVPLYGMELVGGLPTGGTLFSAVKSGLSSVPKAGKVLKYATPIASGAITGGAYGGFQGDSAEAAVRGAKRGAIFGLVTDAVARGINAGFSAMQKIKDVPRGLPNVVQTDKGTRVLDRAVRENKKIAKEVYGQAPAAKEQVNQNMARELDNAIGRRIDIDKTYALQEQRYADFMNRNGDMNVLSVKPTKEHLIQYKPQSQFNVSKTFDYDVAKQKLIDRAQKSSVGIKGNVDHFISKRGRGNYVRTLSNTLERPDITYSYNGNDYVLKKYDAIINGEKQPIFDFVVKQDGKLYNKFVPDNVNYVSNQLKKPIQNMSLNGVRISGVEGTYPLPESNYIITYSNGSVNPNVEKLYNGLNTYQKNALDTALKTGKDMTTSRFGSLNHINETKKVLNDMIERSKNQTFAGSKATNETVKLNDVKKRIDGLLSDSGTKALDKTYSKVYRLQDAYEQGAKFSQNNLAKQPSFNTIIEKRAFADGLKDKIINNSSNKNIANEVLKNQDALKRVLPDKSFKKLIEAAKENNLSYDRLSTLASKAGKATGAAEPISKNTGRIREILESLGSVAGGTIDIAKRAITADSASRAANYLLNPNLPAKQPLYDTIQQYLPTSAVILKESKTKRKENK